MWPHWNKDEPVGCQCPGDWVCQIHGVPCVRGQILVLRDIKNVTSIHSIQCHKTLPRESETGYPYLVDAAEGNDSVWP